MNGKALLDKWKKKLDLTGWDITLIDKCSPLEMCDPNRYGQCEYNYVLKVAIIKIVNPINCERINIPFDYERTLVHELLHIKFALIDNTNNDIQFNIVHQIIEDMAKLLTEK